MPTRNQTIIRRDINRLNELLESKKDYDLSLETLLFIVSPVCNNVNKAWQQFQSTAVKGDKERKEATEILPEENKSREALTEISIKANKVLVTALDTVRAVFGKTSPEYKQFIQRKSKEEEEDEIDKESNIGEE